MGLSSFKFLFRWAP